METDVDVLDKSDVCWRTVHKAVQLTESNRLLLMKHMPDKDSQVNNGINGTSSRYWAESISCAIHIRHSQFTHYHPHLHHDHVWENPEISFSILPVMCALHVQDGLLYECHVPFCLNPSKTFEEELLRSIQAGKSATGKTSRGLSSAVAEFVVVLGHVCILKTARLCIPLSYTRVCLFKYCKKEKETWLPTCHFTTTRW